MSVLTSIGTPVGWQVLRLAAVLERRKETGKSELRPLSVFIDVGVVPRASRSDNHNKLGADLGAYLVVCTGDIVFNKLRTWQGGIGRSAYEGIVSPAYFVCAPNHSVVDSRFLHYLLRSAPYLAEFTRVSKFMPPSQFDIGWDTLKNVSLLLPPLPTQTRIADVLDAETARIDDALARAESLRTLIDERTASVRERLLQEVPVAKLVPLRRVATVQTGLTLNAAKNSGAVEERPYLRVANVQPGVLALDTVKSVPVSNDQIYRHTLRYGDVLMTEGGDRDKLGRGVMWRDEVPGALHQNHVFAVRPDVRKLLPEYLEIVLASSRARRYFESTANQTTNLASTNTVLVGALDVPRPASADQQRIVRQFGEAERRHAALKSAATRQIALLRERRQALITAAVTGKLDVG